MARRRPFEGLLSELRKVLARYILEARRKDRGEALGKAWVSQSRGLSEYFFFLGIMPSYLEAWIAGRLAKGNIEVFEAGMGQGQFSGALLERYGKVLRVEGLRLTYSSQLKGRPGLRQRVGMLESISINKSLDLVISARGAFVYSLNSFAALETILNAMKQEAVAYFDDGKLLLPKAWFRRFLETQEIQVQVTRYKRGSPYAYKITKKSDRRLDLSSFIQRYIEGLNSQSEMILKWGFDRIEEASPMTALMSSLYEEARFEDLLREEAGEGSDLGGPPASENRNLEVSEIGGVAYINDAHSQNEADLRAAFEKWRARRILWISGGESALRDLKVTASEFPIHGAIFFGEGRRELAEAFGDLEVSLHGRQLKSAVEKAYHVAVPGDVVLFSPGLPPDPKVHGTCENRAADFRRCLGELQEMSAWARD